ncbi:MAG: hypothetical protein CSB48_10375 [Proteobacteria bacterium]|nr:MAG: hypothetical protein CSB48_10375 [Pseudomonadota bacterium]
MKKEIELVLYTTLGCHLCDIAETVIVDAVANLSADNSELAVYLTKTDIADDEGLFQRYAESIPVFKLPVSDRELAWPFDSEQVLQLLQSELSFHR